MINSMIINEAILITLLICMCSYVTVTDIKHGIIQNKVLLVTGIVGMVANSIYYTFWGRAFFLSFILNFLVMMAISITFYALHIWAAGDSKLLMFTTFLIPARIYYNGNNVTATAVIIIFIFATAYLYIIGESIYLGIKEKNLFKINRIKADVKLMIVQYIKCTCLVTLFGFIIRFIVPEFYNKNIELMMIINMIIILLSYNFKFFDRIIPLLCLCTVTIVSYIFIQDTTFNFNLKIYTLVLAVLLLRLFAEKYNYLTIPTSKVEKGMVLAYSTIIYFIPSKIKGLPKEKTTEDIRSRITAEEVESIKKWENSKYGQTEITIVRKIPFAIFISSGSVIYTFARMLIK
mgnify:CR=1 FL=1|jgi:archaeal preflagellin peptidase FlaK